MEKNLYRFHWDCGRSGDLEGLFIAEDEGLYYAVFDYVDPDTIEDAYLRQKVVDARYAMHQVKEYIDGSGKK